jgi:hypothetical protein
MVNTLASGTGVEGWSGFDLGQDLLDGVELGLPGEVQGHGGPQVAGAHEEVVGGAGAELGDVGDVEVGVMRSRSSSTAQMAA